MFGESWGVRIKLWLAACKANSSSPVLFLQPHKINVWGGGSTPAVLRADSCLWAPGSSWGAQETLCKAKIELSSLAFKASTLACVSGPKSSFLQSCLSPSTFSIYSGFTSVIFTFLQTNTEPCWIAGFSSNSKYAHMSPMGWLSQSPSGSSSQKRRKLCCWLLVPDPFSLPPPVMYLSSTAPHNSLLKSAKFSVTHNPFPTYVKWNFSMS